MSSKTMNIEVKVGVKNNEIEMKADLDPKVLQEAIREATDETSELQKTVDSIAGGINKAMSGMAKGVKKAVGDLGTEILDAFTVTSLEELAEATDRFGGDFAQELYSLQTNLDSVKESLITAFMPIAEVLVPVLGQAIDAVAQLVNSGEFADVLQSIAAGLKAVSDWISENRVLVETMAIVLGSLAAAWALVNGALSIWNVIAPIAKNSSAALAVANSFLTSPITLVTIAIGALIAIVILLVKNWDTVKETAIAVWENIKNALSSAAEWFNTNIIQPIVGFFTGLWESITEIAANIWNAIVSAFSGFAQWIQDKVIQPIKDFFAPIGEWFSKLFAGIGQTVSDVFHNIVVLVKGYLELVFTIWKTIGIWFYDNVIKPVVQLFVDMWDGICTLAADAWTGIQNVFWTVVAWFDTNVVKPVAAFFVGLWDGFTQAASDAWEAVKSVFSAVTGFFKDIFSKAWEGVVKVFDFAGDIFTNIKDGILGVFKTIVNGLIDGINAVVAVPFNGINAALGFVRDIRILGITPFADLRMISVPEIPHLAQGAVLPANKPFLAVVGDQKHGTNVEAPLATIQEAVALVMQDQFSGMMAGFEASVGVQKQILQAVLGIEIGDSTIGQAAARYNRKMAVIQGGM